MKKTLSFILIISIALGFNVIVFADSPTKTATDFDPSEYTDEALLEIQDAIAVELRNRNKSEFCVGAPFLVSNEYGSYYITIQGVHIKEGTYYQSLAKALRGDEAVCISLYGAIENVDCDYNKSGSLTPEQICEDVTFFDQDGFKLEYIMAASNQFDGQYEIGANTSVGEKKRAAMTFIAFTDTESVSVSLNGQDILFTIPLD